MPSLRKHFLNNDDEAEGHRRHGSVLDHRVSLSSILIRINIVRMASAAFRYLSPKSVTTMSRLDHTIISVHEDDPESPTLPATEMMIADVLTTSSNQRTKNQFRPRVGKGGATSYQLRQYAEVTLGGGSLRKVVKLPDGEDENEWLAVNSGFLARIRLLSLLMISVITFCRQWSISTTKSTCCMEQSPSSALLNHAPK